MGKLVSPKLDVTLPPGWSQHSNPGEPLEYRATADGSSGVLQVSRLPDDDFSYVSGQEKLGPFAAEMGSKLNGRVEGWGKPLGNKEGSCAMGRLGFAMFGGGRYPATLLWITVSKNAAYMWTWLGPDPTSDEVKQALAIVTQAQEAKNPTSAFVQDFLGSLDKISVVRNALPRIRHPE